MAKKKVTLDDDFEDNIEEVDVEENQESPEEPDAEPKSRGRNTGLTIALCALNIVAALAFTFLLLLDFQKRQEWSYAVFLNELFIQGLPLKQEDQGPSASRVTMPRQQLDSKQIQQVFSQRGGKGAGEFWAVDEPFPNRIAAQQLTPDILKDYFGPLGAVVTTLEDEIVRLKDKVPADIAGAAQEVVAAAKAKNDAAKRQLLDKLLLPLAYDTYQVEALDARTKKAKGAELDKLLDDAVQRRLLIDIVGPCEIFRPGDVKNSLLAKVADVDKFKLDDLKALLAKRFEVSIAAKFDGSVHQGPDWDGQDRWSVEKRQTIGFLLVTLASVLKPDPARPEVMVPLYPDAAGAGTPNFARAQTVLGLYEFAASVQNLPIAWNVLEQHVLDAIRVDREGFEIVKGGKLLRNQAFIDKYAGEIKKIQDLVGQIKEAEKRLKDLQEQNKGAQTNFQEREMHMKDLEKKLLASRAETAKKVDALRELQRQLFAAQAELRNADEINARLVQEIKSEERKSRGLKGAAAP